MLFQFGIAALPCSANFCMCFFTRTASSDQNLASNRQVHTNKAAKARQSYVKPSETVKYFRMFVFLKLAALECFFFVWIQCNFRAEVRDITVPNYFQKWARFYCTTAPQKGSTAICLLICQVPIIISDLHYFRLQWPLPYNESPDSNLCWGTAVIYHSWMILSKEYGKCRVSTKMTVFLDHFSQNSLPEL